MSKYEYTRCCEFLAIRHFSVDVSMMLQMYAQEVPLKT